MSRKEWLQACAHVTRETNAILSPLGTRGSDIRDADGEPLNRTSRKEMANVGRRVGREGPLAKVLKEIERVDRSSSVGICCSDPLSHDLNCNAESRGVDRIDCVHDSADVAVGIGAMNLKELVISFGCYLKNSRRCKEAGLGGLKRGVTGTINATSPRGSVRRSVLDLFAGVATTLERSLGNAGDSHALCKDVGFRSREGDDGSRRPPGASTREEDPCPTVRYGECRGELLLLKISGAGEPGEVHLLGISCRGLPWGEDKTFESLLSSQCKVNSFPSPLVQANQLGRDRRSSSCVPGGRYERR